MPASEITQYKYNVVLSIFLAFVFFFILWLLIPTPIIYIINDDDDNTRDHYT